jgi:hypothetical protein
VDEAGIDTRPTSTTPNYMPATCLREFCVPLILEPQVLGVTKIQVNRSTFYPPPEWSF